MEEEATLAGAESDLNTETALDPDESLINALTATDDDDSDDSGAEPEPAADLFTVKINGEEKQVSRDELIAHYQKEQAASQKFEEAASIRREAEQQREQYLQHQQFMAQAVEQLKAQAQQWAQEGQPDWQQLLDENPHEYLKQREIFQQRAATLQQAQAAQTYLQQQQAEQQQVELQQRMAVEGQKLIDEFIPEWKDQAVRERDEQEMIDYLTAAGYSQQDLINLNHSRASNIALARKAMLYDRAMTKAQKLKKQQPTAANPVPTVGGKARSVKNPADMTDEQYAAWRRSAG